MVVGLDYHNTIDKDERLFKKLATAWRTQGIQVYIISALKIPSSEDLLKLRTKCKVPNDGIEIVFFKDYKEIADLKYRACKRYSVDLLFDDSPATCKYLAKKGIMTAQIR